MGILLFAPQPPHALATTENRIGWFSLLGFVILGLPAIGESMAALDWPRPVGLTAALPILASIGAVALWIGNDPTARDRMHEAERTR